MVRTSSALRLVAMGPLACCCLVRAPPLPPPPRSSLLATPHQLAEMVRDAAVGMSPQSRFEAVALLVASALASKVTQSPLARERRDWVRPANTTGEAWRSQDVARWRLSLGDDSAATVAIFLREWASIAVSSGELSKAASAASVEEIEDGVRIRWQPRAKYLSANEERRLEKRFEKRLASRGLDPLALPQKTHSIYRYPKRHARVKVGGLDLVVVARDNDITQASLSRCAYALNEPIKEASERRLVAILDRDLRAAYGAVKLDRNAQQPPPPQHHKSSSSEHHLTV